MFPNTRLGTPKGTPKGAPKGTVPKTPTKKPARQVLSRAAKAPSAEWSGKRGHVKELQDRFWGRHVRQRGKYEWTDKVDEEAKFLASKFDSNNKGPLFHGPLLFSYPSSPYWQKRHLRHSDSYSSTLIGQALGEKG